MKYKKFKLKLTQEQLVKLSGFIGRNKVRFNVAEYALVTQPNTEKETLDVLFLTSKEIGILSKAFEKIRIF